MAVDNFERKNVEEETFETKLKEKKKKLVEEQ
jgi:hypothetical protein